MLTIPSTPVGGQTVTETLWLDLKTFSMGATGTIKDQPQDWNSERPSAFIPTDQSSSSPRAPQDIRILIRLSQPREWSWWLILQIITAVVGIIGNLLVIVILFQRRKQNRNMDILTGALATADLLTSIFMIPFPILNRVPSTILGEIYCKIVASQFLFWVSVSASIMTLTFIPVERYFAVVYPLRFKEFLSKKRVSRAVLLIWFMSFLEHSVFLFTTRVEASEEQCIDLYSSRQINMIITTMLIILMLIIPIALALILQALTARSLHRQAQLHLGVDKGLNRSNPSVRHFIAKRRVLQLLFLVTLVFIVSWVPCQTFYLLSSIGFVPYTTRNRFIQHALNVLACCNSSANPFIYALRYPDFRQAMKELCNSGRQTEGPLFDDRAVKSPRGQTEEVNKV
ncbi:QRFP-like peptide receptor [Strongylocentrotus purpuratus]|uniref:G-protein coupled receptors family 1 profile domain-containing protein n=1 Tax=Strongylocentrotus purpuratus TaxID=7668 RepID=A0A7M7HLW5_STRPU|nr:QRFP-like peptide receptor [Strongylocentrotus purpuratus]|eukprot:XP_011669789.1 PREDICTED: trace amine-associated receptor 7h-like [Strongylocentrotus purpuratus]